jgi:predicted ATPase/DNA-binding SARP family transcriptional activator
MVELLGDVWAPSYLSFQAMYRLPLQLTSFIGREQEVAEVSRLAEETRLLTLTGPGGCGKTRLALQCASTLQGYFSDGVCWIDLAAITDPDLLLPTLLVALPPPPGHEQPERTPVDALIEYLYARELLLVLDNCEHLAAACAYLAEILLRACPSLHILATSRERLGMGGERVWLVPSLSTPPETLAVHLPPLDELARYEAVRMFVERAQEVKHTFRLTVQNAAAVAQICHRLDGIPLAIELAAARTPVLSAGQIASHLDHSFRLLDVGGRTLLPRHRTLQAVMDWSHGLLSATEQSLLWRLSVFRGGFNLEAVEGICADPTESPSGIHRREVLETLARLIDKSLVAAQEQEGMARYRLLEVIRQYAGEKLAAHQEESMLHRRHLEWCLSLSEEAAAAAFGPRRAAWVARLEREHDNLRAGLERSLGPNAEPALAEQGGRLATALITFWSSRGHASEGRLWLERVLAHSDGSASAIRAQALAGAGFLAWCQNDYAQASPLLEQGQTLARTLGDEGRPALQVAVNILGSVAYYQDNYVRATALFEEWLALLRELGDWPRIPFALTWLGRVAVRQGDYARATLLGEESLAISRQSENVHSIATTLNMLGTVAYCLGDIAHATLLFQESLGLCRDLGHRQDLVNGLVMLASVALQQGDLRQAADALEESLSLARDLGYRQGVALSLSHLGEAACANGDFAHAEALLKEGLALLSALGARWLTLHNLETFAGVAVSQGRSRQAAQLLAAVDSLRAAFGAPRPPIDRSGYERTLAAARAILGAAAFATTWADGTSMGLSQAVACALRDEGTSAVPIASIAAQREPLLRICALGTVEIYCAGHLLTNAEWTYAKPRELFFYLLCHPPRRREQIGLVLWPDASPAQLRSRLHIALHRLRQALGRPDWVLFDNGRYTFNHTLDIWFDVTLFESNLQQAQTANATRPDATSASPADAAIQRLEETLHLYRGDFLEEMEPHEWVLQRREELRSSYLAGLLTLGQWRFAAGHYEAAAEVYRRAIGQDAYLETAHRELMRCLGRLGATNQALCHYQTLIDLLREDLGAPPAPETIDLVASLRRSQRV